MKSIPRILIVDDDWGRNYNSIRKRLCFQLGIRDITNLFVPAKGFAGENNDFIVDDPIAEAVFISGQKLINDSYDNDLEATLNCIEEGWHDHPRWSLLLLDLCFYTGKRSINGEITGRSSDSIPSNYFGLQVLRNISKNPTLNKIPIGVLSSMERDPIESEFSDNMVRFFCDKRKLNDKYTLSKLIDTYGLIVDDNNAEDERVIGHSIPLLECLREGRKAARMGNTNVLLLGESGTGKELLAKYIHRKSVEYGRQNIFYAIDLNTVTSSMLESQMTGYTKGSFTGADKPFLGLKVANGGTVFFDELGDYSDDKKSVLYRILEEETREIRPLGETKVEKLNLLIILATERKSIRDNEVERISLMRRINAQQAIMLPALRNRKEDILPLVDYFIEKYKKEHEAKDLDVEKKQLENIAKEWLVNDYDWRDGNISSLSKSIQNCMYSYPSLRIISLYHIKESLGLTKDKYSLPDDSMPEIKQSEKSKGVEPIPTEDNQITSYNYERIYFSRVQLKGRLKQNEKSHKLLNAIYIVKALLENIRPNGEFNFAGTMKLLYDDDITPTKANQLFVKFVEIDALEELKQMSKEQSTIKALNYLQQKLQLLINK